MVGRISVAPAPFVPSFPPLHSVLGVDHHSGSEQRPGAWGMGAERVGKVVLSNHRGKEMRHKLCQLALE